MEESYQMHCLLSSSLREALECTGRKTVLQFASTHQSPLLSFISSWGMSRSCTEPNERCKTVNRILSNAAHRYRSQRELKWLNANKIKLKMIGAKSVLGFDSCFNLNAYTVFISNALIVCLHLRLHFLHITAINLPNIFVTIPSEITFFFSIHSILSLDSSFFPSNFPI